MTAAHVYDCPVRFGFEGAPAVIRVLANDADHAFIAAFNLVRAGIRDRTILLTGDLPRRVVGAA